MLSRALMRTGLALSMYLGNGRAEPLPVERYCEGHAVQEAFLADSRRVLKLLCGRRTGKTVVFAVKGVKGAQGGQPGQWVVYITRTRKNAKKQVWPWIKRILRESNIPHKVNESDLSVEIEGAAGIMLGGADDIAEIEKYRGFALVGAIVDECGIYPSHLLEVLIDEVLEPATVDVGGWMVFGGTPGYVLTGRWYDMTGPHAGTANDGTYREDGGAANSSVYRGNLRSNPHLMANLPPDARGKAVEAFLRDVLERNGWSDEHPTFVREWLGLWAQDDEALVFPLSANRNDYPGADAELGQGPWGLPATTATGFPLTSADWRVVIGVDVGHTSPSSFVVLATHPSLKRTFVVHVEKHAGQLISEMARVLRHLKHTYAVRWGGRERTPVIVIDSGGMGKQHAEELRRVMGIPTDAADKRDKASAIAITRDALLCGRLQLLRVGIGGSDPTAPLSSELHVLVWNKDRDGIEDGQEDHATDGMLYAYRRIRDYTRHEPDPGPEPGTKQWANNEAQKMERAAMKQHRQRQRAAAQKLRKKKTRAA